MRPAAIRVLWLVPPAAALLAFFAWPLTHILASQDADAWRWALTSAYVRSRVAVAFEQAFLSTLLALALAVPLAWLHHRRALPDALLTLHAAPFVMPVFVVVFGLQAVLGNHSILHGVTGIDLIAVLGPLGAVALANAYYNYGVAARLLHAALQRRPRHLEEAAQVLGAPARSAFWRVSVRLLAPSFAAAALLAFLFSFASFGVVLYLGQGRVATLETLLYEQLGGAFARVDRAAVLALLQFGVNLVLLSLVLGLRRPSWQGTAPARRKARGWLAVAIAATALALAPLAAVLVSAFRFGGHWSLEAWRALVDRSHPAHLAGFDLGHAIAVSLGYAAASTVLALGLTLALWRGLRSRAWAEALAGLPLGTSSLVLGLGLAIAYGPGSTDLRGTYVLVLASHTLVALPFVARALLPALSGLDPRLGEAATVLGAPPLGRLLRVDLPQLRAVLAAAVGTAAALSLGEFGAGLLLMTPRTMGLTVWIARHGGPASFDPLHRAESLALAAILLVLTAACAGAAAWAARSRRPA